MLSKATTEEKMLLIGYGAIAVAYSILFIVKYNHLVKK
jgi:hypothetical protein